MLLFFILKINGQEPPYIAIDRSRGLPSNTVYDIFQDSKGYMWFACDFGLVRYDGYEFKTFVKPGQSSRAGTNINEDIKGRIWYQNFDGNVFFIANDTLHSLNQNRPIGYFRYGIVKDKLFLLQKSGVDVYDLQNLKNKQFVALNTKAISQTTFDDMAFYIYDTTGITAIDPALMVKKTMFPPSIKNIRTYTVKAVKGDIIMYNYLQNFPGHVYVIRGANIKHKAKIGYTNSHYLAITDKKYWFCSRNGVYISDTNLCRQNNGQSIFGDFSISSVYCDKEGNYWFSTLGDGILLVKNLSTNQLFKNVSVSKIHLERNTLYAGTSSGEIYTYDLWNKKTAKIREREGTSENKRLYLDSANRLYFAGDVYMDVFSSEGRSSQKIPISLKDYKRIGAECYALALPSGLAFCKLFKNRSSIWDSLLEKYSSKGNELSLLFGGSRVRSLAYNDKTNLLYAASSYGLKLVSPSEVSELKYSGKPVFLQVLTGEGEHIYGLDASGDIFKIDGHRVIPIKYEFETRNESIVNIKISEHYLFIQTNSNLYSADLSIPAAKAQLQDKINIEVKDIRLWNDYIVLSGSGKVIIQKHIKNASPEKKLPYPVFRVNSILVNGETRSHSGELRLKPTENNLEIKYALLSYKNDLNVHLYYRLNEEPWQTIENSRSLKLSSLAPGNYNLKFCPGNPEGMNAKISDLNFTILKPYWQRSWFILLALSVSGSFVYALFRWRTDELKKRNALLREKIENEDKYYESAMKAIKAQMNPHFFYNALNTIQSYIYSEDKKNASEYLNKFSRLTRKILEMSERDTINLDEELEALRLYSEIEQARFYQDFSFELIVPENLNTSTICFPPMLIQPYVENAIKHGLMHKKGSKHLCIKFEPKEDLIVVTVEDNGVGRKVAGEINLKRESKHQSFSGQANKKRLDIMRLSKMENNVEYIDKLNADGTAAGTTVILKIKLAS